MKNIFFYLFVFLISVCNYSQEKRLLPKGVIVDSVAVENTVNESYAIYLPRNYDRQVTSAIDLICDPGR